MGMVSPDSSRQERAKDNGNCEPPMSSELRSIRIFAALFFLSTAILLVGIYYFSLHTLREDFESLRGEIKEIKELIAGGACPAIPLPSSNVSGSLIEELNDIKRLISKEDCRKNQPDCQRNDDLKEIKDLIAEADCRTDCRNIPFDNISKLLKGIMRENAAIIKSLEIELRNNKKCNEGEAAEKKQYSDDCENQQRNTQPLEAKASKMPTTVQSDATATRASHNEIHDAESTSHTQFEPGDCVEIIEFQEEDRAILFPGVIADINVMGGQETTYDIVKFDTSTIIKGLKRDQFRKYQIYPKGTKAYLTVYRERKCKQNCIDHHKSISIVDYHSTALPNKSSELHGKYTFTFAGDDTSGKVLDVQALRIHRFLET